MPEEPLETQAATDEAEPARLLRLESVRVRAAAEAARLDSRAAEIEILLRRILAPHPEPLARAQAPWPITIPAATDRLVTELAALGEDAAVDSDQLPITRWDQLVQEEAQPPTNRPPKSRRHREHSQRQRTPQEESRQERPRQEDAGPAVAAVQTRAGGTERRRRPAAWVISLGMHIGGLLALGAITISIQHPRDQMSLCAAVVNETDEPMEKVVLQPADQPALEIATKPAAVTTESPVPSEILGQPIRVPGPQLTGPPLATVASGPSLDGQLASSIATSAADMSTQFFGTAGGGNHFVYLVDNSASMNRTARDGFHVARAEVLRAVDQLNADQRFYVIFFGEQTLRMRIRDAAAPETHSVQATEEHKAALRRWAAGVTIQPGRWPKEALAFAFQLRPDCIFLLTDGEMPDYVDGIIRDQNIVETLLDGPKPRSIIHTIGFHSREGERQLSAIAAENGGQYRFVPSTGGRR